MTRLISYLLCALGLCGLLVPARLAQTKKTPVRISEETREFERAVEGYRVEFSLLAARRGGVPEDDALVFQFREKLRRLSAATVSKLLRDGYPKGTSVLFYHYEQESLRAWVIDGEGLKGHARATLGEAEVRGAVMALRQALGIERLQRSRAPRERLLVQEEDDDSDASEGGRVLDADDVIRRLTALLLPPPVARALAGTRHLIVVPVLEIGLVPFAVLKPFGEEETLIDRMSISFAPSLFDLTAERPASWSPVFERPLIVGNPLYTEKSRWRIPPLPGAEAEAMAVASLLQARPLIGREATKGLVLKQVREADLLYFATHGIGDNRNSRNNSFLVFGPTQNDEGFWSMKEILDAHQTWGVIKGRKARAPLRARLAVLSACQTGTGEAWKGGVLSLGRTMQASGVPRVVMSLWNVSDQATVDLMTSFVRHTRQEIPAEALRRAMLETRAKHPSEAHWAAFVYFGLPY